MIDFIKELQNDLDNIEELDEIELPCDGQVLSRWIKQAKKNDTEVTKVLEKITAFLSERMVE